MNLSSDRIRSPLGQPDVCLLFGILIMLLWPWIFLSIIWACRGVQMDGNLAMVVKDHPQRTSFFITLFANIVSIIVSVLFSMAVVRFSQQWAMNRDHVTVFDVSLISAFRNQNWPWGIKDHKYLLIRKRWLPAVLAGVCIASFAVVPSGTTSLITPVSFQKTWNLTGTELDFSSNDTCYFFPLFTNTPAHLEDGDCFWNVSRILSSMPASLITWIYQSLNGTRYKVCRRDQWQLVNILESGRSSVS